MILSFAYSYYYTDGLSSINSLSNQAGTLVNSYEYDAWGILRNQTASVQNSFQYTARENSEAGLTYYRARYYHAGVARFVSEDSLRFGGGTNFYAYVANSPIMSRDPLGLVTVRISPPVISRLPVRQIPLKCGTGAGGCTEWSMDMDCSCEPEGCCSPPQITFTLDTMIYIPNATINVQVGNRTKPFSPGQVLAHEMGHHYINVDFIQGLLPAANATESICWPSQSMCAAACAAFQGIYEANKLRAASNDSLSV